MTAHKPSPIDDYNNRINNRFKIILNEQIEFDELIGQVDVIGKLKAFGDLYQEKGESPEHILLLGPNGMGKRTIARAFAKRYLVGLYEVEGKALSDEHLFPLLSSIGM